MNVFPETEQTFLLSGPAGGLEVIAAPAKDSDLNMTVVICHPHPLHGGTMHNKVVTTLHRTLRDLGMNTIRFNYRGVGNSEGEFAYTEGERDDLRAVLAWLQQVKPQDELVLAGFSFGSYISAAVANEYTVKQLISVAPAVTNSDFDGLIGAVSCPWVVVQGDLDEVIDADAVYAWLDKFETAPALIRMPEASHFFHGKLVELRDLLTEQLRANLGL